MELLLLELQSPSLYLDMFVQHPGDPYADVCRLDHGHVVGAVPNGQGDPSRLLPDHPDERGLLPGLDPVADHGPGPPAQLEDRPLDAPTPGTVPNRPAGHYYHLDEEEEQKISQTEELSVEINKPFLPSFFSLLRICSLFEPW